MHGGSDGLDCPGRPATGLQDRTVELTSYCTLLWMDAMGDSHTSAFAVVLGNSVDLTAGYMYIHMFVDFSCSLSTRSGIFAQASPD